MLPVLTLHALASVLPCRFQSILKCCVTREIRRSRASSADHGKIAAVPPLWSVKELNESFVVRDATGQPLAYVFEDERQRQMSMR